MKQFQMGNTIQGTMGSRMFIESIASTTIHTIKDTSNEEDPHVYNHIHNPSYNQLHKYMAIYQALRICLEWSSETIYFCTHQF